jgi:hypothetical protein
MTIQSECAFGKPAGKAKRSVWRWQWREENFLLSDGIKSKMKQTSLFALLLLAACATDRTVEAHIAKTGESFTGRFDPGTFAGSLEMESEKTKCTGRTAGSETVGTTVVVLICDDGRTGSAVLLDGPTRSTGSGTLGDDQVSLSISR